MESNFSDSQYHPDFLDCPSSVDFAVTLVSQEKTLFRVGANVLKAASPVFATILSLPQPEGSPCQPVIDNLDEDATTIEGLLRMITGKEFPLLDTIDAIEPLALAAHKWEMPGPLSILKTVLLRDPTVAKTQPIKLYSLGCRLKWGAVVNLASKFACNCDLFQYPEVQDSVLESIDPNDLLRLVKFHRYRRKLMEEYFGGKSLVPYVCGHIRYQVLPQIQLLRAVFLEDMDKNPPGKSLVEGRLRQMCVASGMGEDEILCTECDRTFSNAVVHKIADRLMEQWKTLPLDLGVKY